ncbi:mCG1036968, partial [Mus musculus]
TWMSLKNSCFLLSGVMSLSFPEKPVRSSQEQLPQENIESHLLSCQQKPLPVPQDTCLRGDHYGTMGIFL